MSENNIQRAFFLVPKGDKLEWAVCYAPPVAWSNSVLKSKIVNVKILSPLVHYSYWIYIGYTTDYFRRMTEHEEGRSKSTACRRPFSVVLCEYYFTKADALRREEYFKTSTG